MYCLPKFLVFKLRLKKALTHLEGRKVEVKSKPKEIIQPFSVKVVKGEETSLNNPNEKGTLHDKFIVSVPSKLSQDQEEITLQTSLHFLKQFPILNLSMLNKFYLYLFRLLDTYI